MYFNTTSFMSTLLKLFEIYVCKMYLSAIMSSLCINNAAKSRVAMSPQLYSFAIMAFLDLVS